MVFRHDRGNDGIAAHCFRATASPVCCQSTAAHAGLLTFDYNCKGVVSCLTACVYKVRKAVIDVAAKLRRQRAHYRQSAYKCQTTCFVQSCRGTSSIPVSIDMLGSAQDPDRKL
jgi:Fe-S-cluster-containing dehydrogenase component